MDDLHDRSPPCSLPWAKRVEEMVYGNAAMAAETGAHDSSGAECPGTVVVVSNVTWSSTASGGS